MKKILTAALAVIVAALALTGCNSNSNSNNSSSTNESSNTSSTNSDNSTSTDNSTSSGGDSSDVAATGKAKSMAEAALAFNPDEWSAMINEVSDAEALAVLFPSIDISICEDYCFMVDMTGINRHEIFVAKAKAGNEDALKSAFDSYLASLKSPEAMLYPAGEESVAGAVSGVTSDGYNYLIIHANGENIAAAMTAAN